jgi:putative effector of murein hydrolase
MRWDDRKEMTMGDIGPGLPSWLAFTLGGLSGLAALLRSGLRLTWRRLLAALLYNGLATLAVALAIEGELKGDPNLIGAVCILSGIGGASLLDVIVAGVRVTLSGPTRRSE